MRFIVKGIAKSKKDIYTRVIDAITSVPKENSSIFIEVNQEEWDILRSTDKDELILGEVVKRFGDFTHSIGQDDSLFPGMFIIKQISPRLR